MWAYVLSGNTARFGEFSLRHLRDLCVRPLHRGLCFADIDLGFSQRVQTAHRTLEARYSVVWVTIRPVFSPHVVVAPGRRS